MTRRNIEMPATPFSGSTEEAEAYHMRWLDRLGNKKHSFLRKIGRKALNLVGIDTRLNSDIDWHQQQLNYLQSPISTDTQEALVDTSLHGANKSAEQARIELANKNKAELEAAKREDWEYLYGAPYISALQDWEKGNINREQFREDDLEYRGGHLLLLQTYDERIMNGLEPGITLPYRDDIESAEELWASVNKRLYDENETSFEALLQREGWQGALMFSQYIRGFSDEEKNKAKTTWPELLLLSRQYYKQGPADAETD